MNELDPEEEPPSELSSADESDGLNGIQASFEGRLSTTTWQGPIPPPHMLREYREAFPDCPERIVAMAEAEARERHDASRHEREARRLIIEGDVYSQKVGLVLAFVLAVFVIGIGAFLIYTGHLAWGTSIVGFPLIALISLFLYGKQQQAADLRREAEQDESEEEDGASRLSS